MKLQSKIQHGMFFLITVSLILSYGLFISIIYNQSVNISRNEVRQDALYIKRLLAYTSYDLLRNIDTALNNTRVTVIDNTGTVLYDSNENMDFENHLQRPEVQEAFQGKIGEDIRVSDSLGIKMFYYAELIDGKVLRIAKKFNNVWGIALRFLPMILLTACTMFMLAYMLVKILVIKIIVPINEIDLDNPLKQKNYDEIIPLLTSIEKQNRDKEKIDTMRKEFSANVSHELKTPLTSISGYAELMKNNFVQKEDIPDFSERIYKEAQRLIQLIDNIILISSLDEEKIKIQKEEVRLFPLIQEICSRLKPVAQEKNVHIDIRGEEISFFGIRYILDEMLYNLVENAIKYNKDNGQVRIWLGTEKTSANTLKNHIIIEDTGIGIAEEFQERIFERFYRVDKSHSSKMGGSGLGLSIVKHGAMIHHIHLKLESTPQKGTKIFLEF